MVNRTYEGGIDKERLSCKFSFRTTNLSSPHTHITPNPPFPSHRCEKRAKVKDNLQQVLVS